VEVVDERVQHLREVTGATAEAAAGETIRAPMPGLVLRIEVEPGDEVAAGDGVVVLEAMKMENEIRATSAGVVREVLVTPGSPVEKGLPMVQIAPAD
jgi:pyruvate carboxylase subunit B